MLPLLDRCRQPGQTITTTTCLGGRRARAPALVVDLDSMQPDWLLSVRAGAAQPAPLISWISMPSARYSAMAGSAEDACSPVAASISSSR